jgi:glycerophosphoryl diester phosphodiesterase
MSRGLAVVIVGGLLTGCAGPPRAADPGPLVIAHRGASAYLPEHTLEAYTLAHALGADVIEPDVVFSRDGVAICAHDIVMQEVTDVRSLFPERSRADGSWYWVDFDLAEIKRLSKTGRRSALDGADSPGYSVATLAEMIALVGRLDAASGRARPTGIIPELKQPESYSQAGLDPAAALTLALDRSGWPAEAVMIQCFDLVTIERLAGLTEHRLVWLCAQTPTDEQLDRAAAVCHGLGPNRRLLEDPTGRPLPLLAEARRRGLALYPWTFTDDREAMARFFRTHRVEGLFTDNPDVGLQALGRRSHWFVGD